MEDSKGSTSFASKTTFASEDYSYSYDAASKAELESLYALISKRFDAKVSNINEVNLTIQNFVNELYSIRKQLDIVSKENQEKQQRLQNIENIHNNEILTTKRKLKREKSTNTELINKIKQLNDDMKEMKENYEAARIECDTKQLKIVRLESQIECMRRMLEATSDKPGNTFAEHIPLFEELINNQSVEIADLLQQRDKLVNSVNNLSKIITEYEKEAVAAKTANVALAEYKKETCDKLASMQKVLPNLAREIDQKLPDDIRDSLACDTNVTPKDFILDSFSALISANSKTKEVKNPAPVFRITDERYLTILNRLENAMRFIAGNEPSELPITADEKQRAKVFNVVARISKFIDEQLFSLGGKELAPSKSTFDVDAFADEANRLSAFLEVASKETLSEAPLRELFCLFNAVCEINKILVDKNTAMIESVKAADDLKLHNAELARLRSENKELRANLEEVAEKSSQEKEELEKELELHIEEEKKVRDELEKQREQLEEKVQSLEKAKKGTADEMRKAIADLQKKLSDQKELVAAPPVDDNPLKKANEALSAEIERMRADGAKGLKAAVKKIKKLQVENSSIQQTVQELSKENERLAKDCEAAEKRVEELREVLEAQNDEVAELGAKNEKLQKSKEAMKDKVALIEFEFMKKDKEASESFASERNAMMKEISSLKNAIEIETAKNELTQITLKKLTEQKASLADANTKLRISERALKLKVSQMLEQEELQRASAVARESSMKASIETEFSKKLSQVKSDIEGSRQKFISIIQEWFEITPDPSVTLDVLSGLIDDELRAVHFCKNTVAEAFALKKKLHIQCDDSLSAAFSRIEKSAQLAQESQAQIEAQLNDSNAMIDKKAEEISVLKAQISSMQDWSSWARAAYMQIAAGSSPRINDKELRESLDDIIFTNMANRSEIIKKEILKAEKKILSTQPLGILNMPGGKVQSIRPLVVAFVITRRIRRVANENNALRSK